MILTINLSQPDRDLFVFFPIKCFWLNCQPMRSINETALFMKYSK